MVFRALTLGAAALALLTTSLAQAQTAAASAPTASTSPAATAAAAASAVVAPIKAVAPAPAAANADTSAAEGKVSYYGRKFTGRKTASGERFNHNALTMAHKTLPFGTLVRVTNLKNKKSVVLRVNDRGPSTPDRVGDVSTAGARKIGMIRAGVAEVKLETVGMSKARHGKAGKMAKKMKPAKKAA